MINGALHKKGKAEAQARATQILVKGLTLRPCGVISISDLAIRRIGVTKILTELEGNLPPPKVYGVRLVTAQATLPLHATPQSSESYPRIKASNNLKELRAHRAFVIGKATIFLLDTIPNKRLLPSTTKRLHQPNKSGGTITNWDLP
jgi:hypothetical protein